MHVNNAYVHKFWGRNSIKERGGECKTREKFNFSKKKGKTVILVENRKFSRSRMRKRIEPLNSSREIK